jgi:hypothetical protein
MHPYDDNARRQLAREHVAQLARDAQRAPKADELPEQAERAAAPALRNRLRRRRPARAAAQRP